ncbi:MAG: hypothetical protein U1F44_04165 [Coriobacteriia bacterium]|nr:hypothetical protein [Coriobacteriia bacterium]
MYTVYADNIVEGDWFRDLSPQLEDAEIRLIGSRGRNPACVDELVRYDRPDIILLRDGKPTLVIEKTREVPTGHNVGQRVARLVRAAEEHVPVIKFFPYDAKKHGDYAGICNMNIRLLRTFQRMTEIHGVPVVAVNWPCDEHGELIDDGSENDVMSALVDDYLHSGLDHDCDQFLACEESMASEYKSRLARRSSYGTLPPSVEIMDTDAFLAIANGCIDEAAVRELQVRPKTLVYTMDMSPDKCRREDPYTGMQFIYDYICCRSGESPGDKHTNLVLRFPRIPKAIWMVNNPNDPSRKSCNWYLTANGLLFSDGYLFQR